jgi:hypothetical protein
MTYGESQNLVFFRRYLNPFFYTCTYWPFCDFIAFPSEIIIGQILCRFYRHYEAVRVFTCTILLGIKLDVVWLLSAIILGGSLHFAWQFLKLLFQFTDPGSSGPVRSHSTHTHTHTHTHASERASERAFQDSPLSLETTWQHILIFLWSTTEIWKQVPRQINDRNRNRYEWGILHGKWPLKFFFRPVFFGQRDVCDGLFKLMLLQHEMHWDASQCLTAFTKIT